jgi:hypothetical protein
VQFIGPIDDMKAFDSEDAQLSLQNGTPRFYIMRLPEKPGGLTFSQITHHKAVTQCLGSLTPEDWCASCTQFRVLRPACDCTHTGMRLLGASRSMLNSVPVHLPKSEPWCAGQELTMSLTAARRWLCRYMAVAEPGLTNLSSHDVRAFKVPFGTFIKLHAGTWHAGPHFEGLPHMDFFNLELADTNQVDHHNHFFDKEEGTAITVLPC